MTETGSTLTRRQLGRYLREYRQGSNMTIVQAADLMQWSESTLQRLETGNAEKIRWRDVKDLCELYSVPGETSEALIGLARQSHVKSWFHEYGDLIPETFNLYVGMESSAHKLTTVQPVVLPGLLQTPDYARTLTRSVFPDDTNDELDGRIRFRTRRQAILTRKTRPVVLEAVIHETAIRRVVGSPEIMAKQLRHLADISTMTNVTVRTLPFSAGLPLGDPVGPFVILEFGKDKNDRPLEPTVVYVENFLGDLYLEKKAAVDRYHRAYDGIQRMTLDDVASRKLLRQVAREYERGH
ncbi:helix-turn-helix domain-containing protein [Nocardia vermiculata]|uniref:Helix-turn-helix domain-containing protein n=1 Tax=Nocardia vermiculata TaxID=257274 RepID=A0A846Y306_9NOCA|nr:helix-turn-helix transcriptional regulator [Nocardia vermiculata]NKY52362.1 helix-turn-helix domain-containing protein [Nocardia vermiculata]